MEMRPLLTSVMTAAAVMCTFVSCSTTQEGPPPLTKYQKFVEKCDAYPASGRYYEDADLLKKATSKSPVYICLSQQRGRLYVDGDVAADWPVSTGVSSHPTPTGSYRIVLKKPHHVSYTYGKIYDAEGNVVVRDADSRTDIVPEGGKFVGSPMPYWMRLTKDGVGMHVGRVVPGRRLSHGCIRMPRSVCSTIYGITSVGTPVTITDKPEQGYPGTQVLQDKARRKAEEEARKQEQKREMEAQLPQNQRGAASQRQPNLSTR